jgi:copper chaperone CopZ
VIGMNSATSTTRYTIDGMSCEHCVRAVDAALRGIESVADVRVEIGSATVTTVGEPDVSRVRGAVESAGYALAGSSAR